MERSRLFRFTRQAVISPYVANVLSALNCRAAQLQLKQLTLMCLKNWTTAINMTQLHQFTTFTNYFWQREREREREKDVIQFSIEYGKTLAQNQLRGFHNNSSNLTHPTANLWADFERRIINMAINEWQNDSGPVSRPKNCTSNTCCNF